MNCTPAIKEQHFSWKQRVTAGNWVTSRFVTDNEKPTNGIALGGAARQGR